MPNRINNPTEPKFVVGDKIVISDNFHSLEQRYNRSLVGRLSGQIMTVAVIEQYGSGYVYVFEELETNYIHERDIKCKWDGVYVAPPIREAYYCNMCGTYFYATDEEDTSLCSRCSPRLQVLPYHRYAPKLEFYGDDRNYTVPYLGIEIEVDEGGESDYSVAKIMEIMNPPKKFFVYCSHDGSLHDGFEIITQPATYEYHFSIMDKYEQCFRKLIEMGYQSHNTTTCGIHVHFNRDFFEDNETLYVSRLLYLVEKFWEEIVIFSRRNKVRLDRYAKKRNTSIEKYIADYNKSGDHDAHYYAINLSNVHTIEFRMFRGTLNIRSFIAILEFVNNCIILAKEKTAQEIQKMEFEDILPPIAKEYYNSRISVLPFEE